MTSKGLLLGVLLLLTGAAQASHLRPGAAAAPERDGPARTWRSGRGRAGVGASQPGDDAVFTSGTLPLDTDGRPVRGALGAALRSQRSGAARWRRAPQPRRTCHLPPLRPGPPAQHPAPATTCRRCTHTTATSCYRTTAHGCGSAPARSAPPAAAALLGAIAEAGAAARGAAALAPGCQTGSTCTAAMTCLRGARAARFSRPPRSLSSARRALTGVFPGGRRH